MPVLFAVTMDRPGPDMPPRVLFEIGGNFLRRMRGGQKLLLENLWSKLKMAVTVDWRMHTTGMYSDIFLPVALSYEKMTFHIPTPDILNLTFSDSAAEPPGEAKSEWEIFRLFAQKIEERAAARGLVEYKDSRGGVHRLDNLVSSYTLDGAIDSPEKLADEWIRDTATFGNLPEGITALVHVHAALMILWLFMVIAQAWFVRTMRFRLHRWVGRSSYLIVPVIILSGLVTTHASFKPVRF